MDPDVLKSEVAILESKLKLSFPTVRELDRYLQKLLLNPGSMVMIAIEAPHRLEGPLVGKAWVSSRDREAIRKALTAINKRRIKAGESPTSEPP